MFILCIIFLKFIVSQYFSRKFYFLDIADDDRCCRSKASIKIYWLPYLLPSSCYIEINIARIEKIVNEFMKNVQMLDYLSIYDTLDSAYCTIRLLFTRLIHRVILMSNPNNFIDEKSIKEDFLRHFATFMHRFAFVFDSI